MNIVGENIILRALELEDMKLLLDMINDPEIEEMAGGWAFPISMQQQMKWYEDNLLNRSDIKLAIQNENNELIGVVDIRNIDWKNRSANHGIKILKKYRNCNYGEKTVKSIMKYVFNELQLNRLSTTIIDYNRISKKLYIDKCKWEIEGKFRKSIFKNNSYHDEVIVSILKEDYEKINLE